MCKTLGEGETEKEEEKLRKKKSSEGWGMRAYTRNPGTWEAEAGESED
jgi:hypothetical protein